MTTITETVTYPVAATRPNAVRDSLVLGGRALREIIRTPDALISPIFIPLFFLVVNVGQAGRIFP
ncbi:MAG TPA: hypothetical protein VFQ14_04935, partial [Thermoleophilaceae bacterium]|nr:hypothetical protein [Thermoleophilaceae bacterium]